MKVTPTAIPDVFIIEPRVFGDSRGFFYESFNQKAFNEATGTNYQFVQDNHSRSAKGVLRKVSMIGRYLKTVRAPHFHESLVSSLTNNRVLDFQRKFEIVPWSMEVGVEESLTATKSRDMT